METYGHSRSVGQSFLMISRVYVSQLNAHSQEKKYYRRDLGLRAYSATTSAVCNSIRYRGLKTYRESISSDDVRYLVVVRAG